PSPRTVRQQSVSLPRVLPPEWPMFCCIAARRLTYLALALLPAALFWGLAAPGAAQKKAPPAAEKDYKDQLPRISPHAPADALKTFQTLSGFRVEQVAAEPLV